MGVLPDGAKRKPETKFLDDLPVEFQKFFFRKVSTVESHPLLTIAGRLKSPESPLQKRPLHNEDT